MRTWTDRRTIRVAISLAAAIAVVGVAAGCGSDKKKSSANKSPAKPASFPVTVTTVSKKKLTLTAPASVKAGLVTMTLTNSDKAPHSASIVRVIGNHSVDEFLKITNTDGPAKIPDWLQDGGGIGTVAPGKTASITQNLAPGRYFITDDEGGNPGPINAQLGAKGEFMVTGAASDAALPPEPATITATDKGDTGYKFSTTGLKAGANQVRFENTGKQLHHALLFPLNKGATLADVKKFAASQGNSGGPPPFDFRGGTGLSVIDGGIAQNAEVDLKAGSYVLLCFLNDRDGGKPHVAKGMLAKLDIK